MPAFVSHGRLSDCAAADFCLPERDTEVLPFVRLVVYLATCQLSVALSFSYNAASPAALVASGFEQVAPSKTIRRSRLVPRSIKT